MAKCKTCGKPSGFFESLCASCRADEEKRLEVEAAHRDVELAMRAERTRIDGQRTLQTATRRAESLRNVVASGQRVFLYESIYIPVDSVVDGNPLSPEFNIDTLRELGLLGWELVQVVPRTMAVALQNTNVLGVVPTGIKAYAGGLGGNIIGVHVLLRREVSSQADDGALQPVVAYALSHAHLPFPE